MKVKKSKRIVALLASIALLGSGISIILDSVVPATQSQATTTNFGTIQVGDIKFHFTDTNAGLWARYIHGDIKGVNPSCVHTSTSYFNFASLSRSDYHTTGNCTYDTVGANLLRMGNSPVELRFYVEYEARSTTAWTPYITIDPSIDKDIYITVTCEKGLLPVKATITVSNGRQTVSARS